MKVVSARRKPIMTKFLLSACAAAVIGIAGSSASAGDFTIADNGPSGAIIPVNDSGYDGQGRSYGWPYQQPNYGYDDDDDDGWNHDRRRWHGDWGQGYGHYGVVPPHRIVRQLARHRFTHITQPVLAGPFYQVKARDPRGYKVKLYINAYTGEIARWKYRG
jgi:hypothetical protein